VSEGKGGYFYCAGLKIRGRRRKACRELAAQRLHELGFRGNKKNRGFSKRSVCQEPSQRTEGKGILYVQGSRVLEGKSEEEKDREEVVLRSHRPERVKGIHLIREGGTEGKPISRGKNAEGRKVLSTERQGSGKEKKINESKGGVEQETERSGDILAVHETIAMAVEGKGNKK